MTCQSTVRLTLAIGMLGGFGSLFGLTQPAAKTPAPSPSAPAAAPEPEEKKRTDDKPQNTLAVGDAAPPIDVDSWIKGEPVNAFESGKVYVVEFWATWCGPCVRAIPHLSELQRKNPSVTVVAVAASERREKDGSDKRLDNLKSFVEKQGDKMTYRVAYDADRGMSKPWLAASGKTTLPTAFIVDRERKVAWVGHPNKLAGELEKILDAGSLRGKDVKPSDER